MFASNLFTPTDAMASWIRAFSDNQPISVVASALRGLAMGSAATGAILGSIVWIAAMLAVFIPLAVSAYRKP